MFRVLPNTAKDPQPRSDKAHNGYPFAEDYFVSHDRMPFSLPNQCRGSTVAKSQRSLVLNASSGFSLIELTIALAILIGAVVTFQDRFAGNLKRMLSGSFRARGMQVQQTFSDTVTQDVTAMLDKLIANNGATNGCSQFSLSGLWTNRVSSLGNMSYTLLSSGNLGATYTGNASHEAAKSRCTSDQSGAAASSTFADSTGFYACLLLSPIGTVPNNSIFSESPVFAEVRYTFLNLENHQPIACKNYTPSATPARGAIVHYAIYWKSKLKNQIIYHTNPGVTYVFGKPIL